MPGDNIYPDLSNDKFDIQYARLLGLSSDLRASFGVVEEIDPPGKFGPIETPSEVDTGFLRFGVADEDDTATENRSFDLNGEFSFALTQLGNNQFLVDPANGLYQLGAVPVPGSDSGLSYTYIEIEDNDKKITLQAPEGIVLPGYGYGNHSGTEAFLLAVDAGGNLIEVASSPGGAGTVTSFSAGNLSPLFTTSVATATTTPALSFSLSNAAGGTVFGNNGSSSAAPAFTSTPVLGIAGTTLGTLGLAGNTSGVVTIQPQAAAGTFNFNLPVTAGTSGYLLTSGGGGSSAMTWTQNNFLTAITADNGITANTATNVRWGGTLMQNTTIAMAGFSTTWSGTVAGFAVTISNSGSGGINASSNGSNAALGGANNSTGPATTLQSTSGSVINAIKNAASLTGYERMANFNRLTTGGTATNGIGGYIELAAEADDGTQAYEASSIKWAWTNVVAASRTSSLILTAVTDADTHNGFSLAGPQSTLFSRDASTNETAERFSVAGTYKALTESSATAFVRINIPSGTATGGEILITVEANDATDYQSRTLRFIWSAVNKAGTITATVQTPEEAVAISTGTLTVTIDTNDAGSGNLDFRANAASSLSQSILRCSYQVFKNIGTGTITPQ